MWIRLSAGLLFILGGMFCGFNMADKLKQGVIFCTEAEKLLNICESEIRSNNSDVYSIVRRLKKENINMRISFERLPECYSPEVDFHQQWNSSFRSISGIDADELDIMLSLGSMLGTTDTEGQLKGISHIRAKVEQLYRKRQSEYEKKGRLYRSIGVLSGAAVGVMII
ncbi:MAG: stage III sporulation protein AB [Ruminococcus sp.]|uniref:stage III sporulation protein AB n=1 Tax=Ruminococcus sp. TaxID=41978 RepID=UPI0025D96DCA|nr:stage III sporulation protein AB [Ruminococcus sp.]MCR4796089.1 stage III sporulation protein AB [Ruminococcus sp.]